MTYTKPEVKVLGDAASLIQSKSTSVQDGGLGPAPAYDLDE